VVQLERVLPLDELVKDREQVFTQGVDQHDDHVHVGGDALEDAEELDLVFTALLEDLAAFEQSG